MKHKSAKLKDLSTEEVQHLKRRGVCLPIAKKQRPLRRFSAWWETKPYERFLEDIAFISQNVAVLDVVNFVASITIIISLVSWWVSRQEQGENELFSAWGVIQRAAGDKSGVARVAAEQLHRQGFSLAGLELQDASLSGATLQKADLWDANLQGADLVEANLQGANLSLANLQGALMGGANLQEAGLSGANLQTALMYGANLQKAQLLDANLQGAHLLRANLQGAELSGANLQKANLGRANLQETYLGRANLQETYLGEANLQGAILLAADIRQVEELQEQQLMGANPPLLCNVALPDNITSIDPDRDCDKIPQILSNRYPNSGILSLERVQQFVDEARQKTWD